MLLCILHLIIKDCIQTLLFFLLLILLAGFVHLYSHWNVSGHCTRNGVLV